MSRVHVAPSATANGKLEVYGAPPLSVVLSEQLRLHPTSSFHSPLEQLIAEEMVEVPMAGGSGSGGAVGGDGGGGVGGGGGEGDGGSGGGGGEGDGSGGSGRVGQYPQLPSHLSRNFAGSPVHLVNFTKGASVNSAWQNAGSLSPHGGDGGLAGDGELVEAEGGGGEGEGGGGLGDGGGGEGGGGEGDGGGGDGDGGGGLGGGGGEGGGGLGGGGGEGGGGLGGVGGVDGGGGGGGDSLQTASSSPPR